MTTAISRFFFYFST
ncbi:pheST operon leader peptide PheM [Symbiopectobacterium sp. Eva_TO]